MKRSEDKQPKEGPPMLMAGVRGYTANPSTLPGSYTGTSIEGSKLVEKYASIFTGRSLLKY